MARWEYSTVKVKAKGFLGGKIDEKDLDAALNNAGREGWELAAAPALSRAYGQTVEVVLIFKRPGR